MNYTDSRGSLLSLVFISRFGVVKTLKAVQNHHGHVYKKSMNFKEFGVIKDHFSLKSTAGMKVKLIICHWDSHLQRSVTSTEASQLIYLFFPPRVCVNPRCCFQRLRRREGRQNEMLSHAWPGLQSISSTLIHVGSVSVELDTKWRRMGNLTCAAETERRRCEFAAELLSPVQNPEKSFCCFPQQQGGREQRKFLSEEFFFFFF